MRRVLGLAFALILSASALLGPHTARAKKPAPIENVSSFPPRDPVDERRALNVPEGFEVQLVAAEPDLHHIGGQGARVGPQLTASAPGARTG